MREVFWKILFTAFFLFAASCNKVRPTDGTEVVDGWLRKPGDLSISVSDGLAHITAPAGTVETNGGNPYLTLHSVSENEVVNEIELASQDAVVKSGSQLGSTIKLSSDGSVDVSVSASGLDVLLVSVHPTDPLPDTINIRGQSSGTPTAAFKDLSSSGNFLASYRAEGKEFPNNSTSGGWLDMSNNELLAHFNEISILNGGIVYDSSGNNKNGSLVTGSGDRATDGQIRRALSLLGSTERLTFGNFGTTPTKGSLSLWVYAGTGAPAQMTAFSSDGLERIEIAKAASDLELQISDGSTTNRYSFNASLVEESWYHVVVTWDTSTNTVKGYINGVPKFSSSNSIWPRNFSNVQIGARTSANSWKGKFDEFALWSRRLSDSEVGSIYSRQK